MQNDGWGDSKQLSSPQCSAINEPWSFCRCKVCTLFFPITSDKNTSTCINAVAPQGQLHVIFAASTFPRSNTLSIGITLMHVDDCNSPAWNWFVGSGCGKGIYMECSGTQLAQVAEFTTCGFTCHCVDRCDILHLKYNHLPWRNQTPEKLCEIWAHRNGTKWSCIQTTGLIQ